MIEVGFSNVAFKVEIPAFYIRANGSFDVDDFIHPR
jgi:hypothetical protein